MGKSISINVDPQVMIWAREDSGYSLSEISKKLKKDIDFIVKLEKGEFEPTLSLLRKLSTYYQKPLASFLLPEVPRDSKKPPDFRSDFAINHEDPKSKINIMRFINSLEFKSDILNNILDESFYFSNKGLTINLTTNAEEVASSIRKLFGLQNDFKHFSKSSDKNYKAYRDLFAQQGIFIFHTPFHLSIDNSLMRGVVLSDRNIPVIGINNKDSNTAKLFSIMHELVHVLLNKSSLCDIFEGAKYRRLGIIEQTEVFCNRVAGSILVPQDLLLAENIVKEKSSDYEWTIEELKDLAMNYGVSAEVVLRRLLILNKTNRSYYNKYRSMLVRTFKNNPKNDSIKIPIYNRVVSSNGKFYSRLLFSQYSSGAINTLELANALDVKVKHLTSLREGLFA